VVFDFGLNSTDDDGGVNGVLTFVLETPGVPFEVDSATGVLTITGRVDREETTFYSLQILVLDGADVDGTVHNDTVTINIPIYDIDDNAPVIVPPYDFRVTEQMTETREVIGNVNVVDPDINGTRVYFILVPEDPPATAGCFLTPGSSDPTYLPIQIDPTTGALFFCEGVDFETQRRLYTFTVRVVDVGSLDTAGQPAVYSVEQDYNVTIVDSNDHPPVLGEVEYSFAHPENELVNAFVGNVTADDQDSGLNGQLSFSISFNGSGLCSEDLPFQIEQVSNGIATLRTCLALDYETRTFYTLTLEVCDNAPILMCASAPVRVNVTDRNDNPPFFCPSSIHCQNP